MRHESESADVHRGVWVSHARAQGLVCLICLEVPPLEDRASFFDTGLCAHCAEELSGPQPTRATPSPGAEAV